MPRWHGGASLNKKEGPRKIPTTTQRILKHHAGRRHKDGINKEEATAKQNDFWVDPYRAKVIYFNFHPQPQKVENYSNLLNLRPYTFIHLDV